MSKETMTITRKYKLYPLGDEVEVARVYKFIRDGMYAQYQGLNLLMGALTSKYYACNRELNSDEFRMFQKELFLASNPILNGIEFVTGVDSKSAITQKVKQDFSTALKGGLAKGERSITNYKRDFPLMTRGRNLVFTQDLISKEQKPFEKEFETYIKWVNKIVFKVILGNNKNKEELMSTMSKIFDGSYKVQGSSIQIDKTKIILNLSLEIPIVKRELDESVVVGVDLGVNIPAVCALNTSKYLRESIGSKDDLLKKRVQLQNQRKLLQSRLEMTTGGKGRKKKLKHLDNLKKSEGNYVKTYCHLVSSKVVDFAIKNNAKYINIEDLSGFESNKNKEDKGEDFILRNWSYYRLQNYIEYKAKKNNIIVRKINPSHTSQICSCCGNYETGQRLTQSSFKCLKCGYTENADFNAARNIAKSTDFIENK